MIYRCYIVDRSCNIYSSYSIHGWITIAILWDDNILELDVILYTEVALNKDNILYIDVIIYIEDILSIDVM